MTNLITRFCCLSLLFGFANAHGQSSSAIEPTQPIKRIHVVYFGGNDCPPCVAFRASEFPKFASSVEFSGVIWSNVTKSVGSAVPSSFFLPSEVKPLRDALLQATGGNAGSAQVVIFVDRKVHDVFWGSRDAGFYQKAVRSITANSEPYPGERCTERGQGWVCKVKH